MTAPRTPRRANCRCGSDAIATRWDPTVNDGEGAVFTVAHDIATGPGRYDGRCPGWFVRTIRAGMVVSGDRVLITTARTSYPVHVTGAAGGYQRKHDGQPDEKRGQRAITGQDVAELQAGRHPAERTWRRPFGERLEVIALCWELEEAQHAATAGGAR